MILVDTSVLIDALKGKDTRLPLMFAAHPAAICGVTVAEVLHGARDADDFKKLEAALAKFPKIAVDDSIWQPLAHNLFLLGNCGAAERHRTVDAGQTVSAHSEGITRLEIV
jgi:predicted nucleic acid-binding protein